MKKILIMLFAIAMIVSLAACSAAGSMNESPSGGAVTNGEQPTAEPPSGTPENAATNTKSANTDMVPDSSSNVGKALVVYYSQTGNTKALASVIQQSTGSDIFELELVDPYPANYNQTTERVGREQREGIAPELSQKLENIDDYDTVFIGSPIWRSTLAPPVASFIAEYDLSGKTVIPFFTSDSGTMGNSVSVIKGLVPSGVTVFDGFAVRGEDANSAQNTVDEWLNEIGFAK